MTMPRYGNIATYSTADYGKKKEGYINGMGVYDDGSEIDGKA